MKDLATPQNDLAWSLYKEVQTLLRRQGELFLLLGKDLKTIRDQKLYRYLGEGGFDTFRDFLNNPEIGIRESTAYLYIRIYEYYIERLKIPTEEVVQIPLNRLMRLLPRLKEREDEEAREIVNEIQNVTTYDFDVIVGEKQLDVDKPLVYRCKVCGKWKIEYKPEQLCTCPVDKKEK